jgi:hypothetical protein
MDIDLIRDIRAAGSIAWAECAAGVPPINPTVGTTKAPIDPDAVDFFSVEFF